MSEPKLGSWYRKENLPASDVIAMPNERAEILHIVKLCADRQNQSRVYDILFFPVINVMTFSAITEFAESGYNLGEIIILIFGFLLVLVGVIGIVSEVSDWIKERPILKKIKTPNISSEEMKLAIEEFSKVNYEFKKDFILGKSYRVYCMEKADAI